MTLFDGDAFRVFACCCGHDRRADPIFVFQMFCVVRAGSAVERILARSQHGKLQPALLRTASSNLVAGACFFWARSSNC